MQTYRYHILAALLVVVDQVTKVLVKGFNLLGIKHEGMELGESFPLLGDFVRITFVENPGMAFGISWGDAKIILTLITVAIAGFLTYYLYKIRETHWTARLAMSLLLAGAVGNLIDRMFYGVFYGESPLFYGLVVDFIQVDIPDVEWMGHLYTHWPVFNVADSCVTIGIVLLLIFGGRLQKQEDERGPELS